MDYDGLLGNTVIHARLLRSDVILDPSLTDLNPTLLGQSSRETGKLFPTTPILPRIPVPLTQLGFQSCFFLGKGLMKVI